MAYIMVSPKAQNAIQTRLFSASYVVLKGTKAIHLNSHLKLHTNGRKEGGGWGFTTQNLFRIDLVMECKKTVGTMLKWKLNGMQCWRLDLSLESLWRTRAAERACPSRVQPRVCPSKLEREGGYPESERIMGPRPVKEGESPSRLGSCRLQDARELSQVGSLRSTSVWKVHWHWMTPGALKSLFFFIY